MDLGCLNKRALKIIFRLLYLQLLVILMYGETYRYLEICRDSLRFNQFLKDRCRINNNYNNNINYFQLISFLKLKNHLQLIRSHRVLLNRTVS